MQARYESLIYEAARIIDLCVLAQPLSIHQVIGPSAAGIL